MFRVAIAAQLAELADAEAPGARREQLLTQRGLPHEFALDGAWSLVLYAPTGVARPWLDAPRDALLSTDAVERASVPPGVARAAIARAPVRLVARRAGPPLAAVPLVVGAQQWVAASVGARTELLELRIHGWEICGASLRAAGEATLRLDFSWRTSFRVGEFVLPPPHRYVLARAQAEVRSSNG